MMRKTKDDLLKNYYFHSDVYISVYLIDANSNIGRTIKKHLLIIIVMNC
jgi:hypothetical protein